jgi:hypothetical protein
MLASLQRFFSFKTSFIIGRKTNWWGAFDVFFARSFRFVEKQGDRFGRFFAQCAIVNFGQFFEN